MVKKDVKILARKEPVAAKTDAVKETKDIKEIVKEKSKPSLSKSVNELTSSIKITFNDYTSTLTPRLKLIDIFLVFLLLLGALQFVYVILIGNFPFNAFLGGFISCVAQFVLTVTLRLQVKNSQQEKSININNLTFSPETSFGDYIFASLILHFVIFHFIN